MRSKPSATTEASPSIDDCYRPSACPRRRCRTSRPSRPIRSSLPRSTRSDRAPGRWRRGMGRRPQRRRCWRTRARIRLANRPRSIQRRNQPHTVRQGGQPAGSARQAPPARRCQQGPFAPRHPSSALRDASDAGPSTSALHPALPGGCCLRLGDRWGRPGKALKQAPRACLAMAAAWATAVRWPGGRADSLGADPRSRASFSTSGTVLHRPRPRLGANHVLVRPALMR